METIIIDASIAIKWVIEEDGTAKALRLRHNYRFAAPDLLVPDCANIFWKKVQRKELTAIEASMAAKLLERSDIEPFSNAGAACKGCGSRKRNRPPRL